MTNIYKEGSDWTSDQEVGFYADEFQRMINEKRIELMMNNLSEQPILSTGRFI